MVRTWFLIVAASAGCKTATEKQCDGMLERYESCTGAKLTSAATSSAHARCYVSLGHDLQPGDTTSFAAIERATFVECTAITECGALKACFDKHQCRWILTSPEAEPFFECSK